MPSRLQVRDPLILDRGAINSLIHSMGHEYGRTRVVSSDVMVIGEDSLTNRIDSPTNSRTVEQSNSRIGDGDGDGEGDGDGWWWYVIWG